MKPRFYCLTCSQCRRLQDMSSRRLQDMSSRRLQRNNFLSSKTSSRRICKTSSRRLGRRKIVTLKTCWRRLQDMSWRRLEDILKINKCLLGNFSKFTGKHLCQSPFFNKVADLRPATLFKKETLAQVFSCEFWGICKNTFFYRTTPVASSVIRGCLLIISHFKWINRFLTISGRTEADWFNQIHLKVN